MDTPQRNQIGTPISKIEDSPVFNFINSLSPIKPVKSIRIAQTFNSLSFAPLPSVFTSPHVSSRKESGFLTRHHLLEPSKPEFLCENQTEDNTSARVSDVVQISDCYTIPQGSFDPGSSIRELRVDSFNENSKLACEMPQTLKYDCGSPEDPVLEVTGTPAPFDQFVQEASVEGHYLFHAEVEMQGTCHLEQTKEEKTECDWENLISDGTEMLTFDSSTEVEASKGEDQKIVGPEISSFTSLVSKLPQDRIDNSQTVEPVGQIGSCEQPEAGDPASQLGEVGKHNEIVHSSDIPSCIFHNKQEVTEKSGSLVPFGSKPDSQQQRGVLRRCLLFEMAGAQKKNLEENSNNSSSTLLQSDGEFSSYDKQLVPIKLGTGSSPCMLPGIGLHLNALAATTKDCNVVKHEILASGRQLISMPSPIASFHSLTPEQKPLNKSLGQNSVEREIDPDVNEVQVVQDECLAAEEFNKSALKKKRRKLEHGGESETCRRCNCKKSKCLKLYCECFAAGVYCVEPCSCQECFNKPIHEDTVLATRKQIESRNPLAFAPKVIRSSDSVPEIGEDSNRTPASARHKRGCNCKKSGCLKKYCECYQGGVGCSINCRCEGCKNSFGRKDGSTPIGVDDVEPEGEEAETCEKNGVDRSLQTIEVQNDEEQYSDHTLPITPSIQICRPSLQLLFSSSRKPPRSFVLSIESSSKLHTSQTLKKSDFLHPQLKFEKHLQIIPEDETPEILRDSPIHGVKTASPSRKRVSPPHSEFKLSPSRRSSRKLVLQSIPSLPPLTPHHETSNFPVNFK